MPYLIALVGLLALWLLYRLFSGRWDLLALATGDDGLPSSSQFQFLVWSVVVVFAYIAVYVARIQGGEYGPIAEIPANLLILVRRTLGYHRPAGVRRPQPDAAILERIARVCPAPG